MIRPLSTKANTSKAGEDKSFKATGQNEKGISEAGTSSADKDVHLSTGIPSDQNLGDSTPKVKTDV